MRTNCSQESEQLDLVLGGFVMKAKIVIFAALILLTACGNSSSTEIVTLSQASSNTAAIYKARCISCHATDLSGKMQERTNLQLVYERLTYDEIVTRISEGGKIMSAYKDILSAEEIEGLASWLSKQ